MHEWNDKNIARSRCFGGPLKVGALGQWPLWPYRRYGTEYKCINTAFFVMKYLDGDGDSAVISDEFF